MVAENQESPIAIGANKYLGSLKERIDPNQKDANNNGIGDVCE